MTGNSREHLLGGTAGDVRVHGLPAKNRFYTPPHEQKEIFCTIAALYSDLPVIQ